jgi:hypothetical protein
MVGARRRVEQGGRRSVVVTVTRPDGVGLAGLGQFLQRVLAHRFEQPVSRSATGVLGDDKRLVDEQGELIEHLVALHIPTARDSLRGIKIKATQEHR